jgi:transcriptional regulator with XRE-family HTH domain
MERKPSASAAPDRAAVLTKAVTNAARLLDISQARVAQALGVSEATASRMFSGKYLLEPGRGKEWELAALLVRLFRSLDSLLASEEKSRAWLNSESTALGGRPIELITRAEGLVSVLHYLDAARGRI